MSSSLYANSHPCEGDFNQKQGLSEDDDGGTRREVKAVPPGAGMVAAPRLLGGRNTEQRESV